jgi:hypothetical protein
VLFSQSEPDVGESSTASAAATSFIETRGWGLRAERIFARRCTLYTRRMRALWQPGCADVGHDLCAGGLTVYQLNLWAWLRALSLPPRLFLIRRAQ